MQVVKAIKPRYLQIIDEKVAELAGKYGLKNDELQNIFLGLPIIPIAQDMPLLPRDASDYPPATQQNFQVEFPIFLDPLFRFYESSGSPASALEFLKELDYSKILYTERYYECWEQLKENSWLMPKETLAALVTDFIDHQKTYKDVILRDGKLPEPFLSSDYLNKKLGSLYPADEHLNLPELHTKSRKELFAFKEESMRFCARILGAKSVPVNIWRALKSVFQSYQSILPPNNYIALDRFYLGLLNIEKERAKSSNQRNYPGGLTDVLDVLIHCLTENFIGKYHRAYVELKKHDLINFDGDIKKCNYFEAQNNCDSLDNILTSWDDPIPTEEEEKCYDHFGLLVSETLRIERHSADAIIEELVTQKFFHSSQYHSVKWRGQLFRFPELGSLAVEALHNAYKRGHTDLSSKELSCEVYSLRNKRGGSSKKPRPPDGVNVRRDFFSTKKGSSYTAHPAFGKFILEESGGKSLHYRLNL